MVRVSRVSVVKWETEEAVPSEVNFKRLAEVFHVTPVDLRYPNAAQPSRVSEPTPSSRAAIEKRRMKPRVYEVVFEYLDRMRRAGCSEEQIEEAERIMTDTAYSQLYARSRREKSDDDQIMDIHAAWKFIAEVIERTEGKKL